ncbi:sarcosine oxidase subunit gamma [Pseudooceanicola sp. CBS1P-1]|uniref:Sarcosine oxidase subunit gamma n=1 Tax=Pseudooceanicola albus TaxID=2692189 RepID=A0A6L7G845_9RHOB|nr:MULTISPECIES: sarcosine oxidase subunit gamma family protein [Pseudooceanicola]MBT9386448.1 sarcosine oxidase subunit gamma [Pseudooceanicola endophyticus]MXN20394.1 sarcosine oxidase subunit gamma [Pseudooceanicola albus]
MTFDKKTAGGVTIEELPAEARFSLRVRDGERAAVAGALGLELTDTVGVMTSGSGRKALCLGPDEWVLSGAPGDAAAITAACAGVYDAAPHSLVEISEREIFIRASGPAVEALMATGVARDLSRIGPGQGARTVFDGTPVVLVREKTDSFRLNVWRSFAPHLLGHLFHVQKELASGL